MAGVQEAQEIFGDVAGLLEAYEQRRRIPGTGGAPGDGSDDDDEDDDGLDEEAFGGDVEALAAHQDAREAKMAARAEKRARAQVLNSRNCDGDSVCGRTWNAGLRGCYNWLKILPQGPDNSRESDVEHRSCCVWLVVHQAGGSHVHGRHAPASLSPERACLRNRSDLSSRIMCSIYVAENTPGVDRVLLVTVIIKRACTPA